MGIKYDPSSKKWDVIKLKTDYDANRPIQDSVPNRFGAVIGINEEPVETGYWDEGSGSKLYKWGSYNYIAEDSVPFNELKEAQEAAKRQNQYNNELNNQAAKLNADNEKINQTYDKTIRLASTTQGGDYKTVRDQIRALDVSQNLKNILEDNFKTFYRTEKLQPWTGVKSNPLYGEFDAQYYKKENPDVAQQWANAVADDDIDITEMYGNEEGFYAQHYTSQGKAAGRRGNAIQPTTEASAYKESTPEQLKRPWMQPGYQLTDADKQAMRALQIGFGDETQEKRLLNIPYIKEEYEKAKNGDEYWKELAKANYLDPKKEDEFVALFRLSKRPEDAQVQFINNANVNYGITELEDAINQAVGEKATVDVKRFGALAQNVLKDTIAEITKAKAKEQTLSMLQGFGGFSEITNINKTLADSIIGDSGIGGILAFTSGNKAEESLLKNLQGMTGVQNNVTYNWQQWFDQTLKQKYSQAQELGYTEGEAQEIVNIDSDFAKRFIEKYLQPRFDESRSMNEFVEYLDVRQEEQNPFQTMDIYNAAKVTAETKAREYLDAIAKTPDRYFDAEFYFNPKGNDNLADVYANQAKTVSEDWEAAKKGDEYWAKQAYRFGVDVNNKEQFAKMHYEAKGRFQPTPFDPAEDIFNAYKISDRIYGKGGILDAMKTKLGDNPNVFVNFIKPQEFADELLKGVDPTDNKTWEGILKAYGIEDFKGSLDELKDYIAESLRTGTASEIRSQIKYLNEQREKPTQENLGLTYIERPEDYKDTLAKSETDLYKTFQQAGYQGTEDEFYTQFFPDVDRSEQILLTKTKSGEGLELNFDLSDPFTSLGTIGNLFGEDEEETTSTSKTTSKTTDDESYFRLGLEDDEGYQKSKSGEDILGEFTSMFKGF